MWVKRGHLVARVEDLADEIRDGDFPVALAGPRRQRSQAGDEEVKTRIRTHVGHQLPQVGVQLSGISEAGRNAGHRHGDQVIQVAHRRTAELQRVLADVEKRFVVHADSLVRAADHLVQT